ncbi:MAG TPA: hypothetical protein VMZ06_13195 [Candidatus Bathyarchaeia archaeon]|nr:hypothetical protein [Candidatus Bathyarchaeia archaeon]
MGRDARKHNRDDLTVMEAKFVVQYEAQGFRNGEKAARLAGYKCPDKIASVVVKRPAVKAEIAKRRDAALLSAKEHALMDRDTLLKLWSTMALNSGIKASDRLTASKLLAEYLGMFEKDSQDNVPRSLLQIVQCVEGRCPRCGEIVRVQPVEGIGRQPASGQGVNKRVQ